MIIKKFVEKDSRSAMAKVRDEFGADAVVLSSRTVGDSFEMVAAANYDEYDVLQQCEQQDAVVVEKGPAAVVKLPTAPSISAPVKAELTEANAANEPDTKNQNPKDQRERQEAAGEDSATLKTLQSELADLKALIQKELPKYSGRARVNTNRNQANLKARFARMGISSIFSQRLLENVDYSGDLKESWEKLIRVISGKLKQNEEGLIKDGGVAAFVGPSGSGKTSTVAKIAAAHLMEHGRGNIGLITTGGLNDPTNEALIKFARAMDIPCKEAKTATNLKAAVEEFSSMKLVLIDTPGVESNDLRLNMQLAEFRLANHPIDSYLVASAEAGSKSLEKSINAFSRYRPVGLVLTKVDKSASLGALIETLIRTKTSLSYISDGTRIPADLHKGGVKDIMKHALLRVKSDPAKPGKNLKPGIGKRLRKSTAAKQRRMAG